MTIKAMNGEDTSLVGMEIHVMSSACKPICSWIARDGIQECREACGGHGYLKCGRLGDLRNENDANCTYEGENNTLIQQASNWLINLRRQNMNFEENSPLTSVSFLKDMDSLLLEKTKVRTPAEAMKPESKFLLTTNFRLISYLKNVLKDLLQALNWLCAYQLEKAVKRSVHLTELGLNSFDSRNEMQVFNAQTLAIIYGEVSFRFLEILTFFIKNILRIPANSLLCFLQFCSRIARKRGETCFTEIAFYVWLQFDSKTCRSFLHGRLF